MAVILVAELGINHSGSLETALEMVMQAKAAGANYVKVQKRDPALSVPRSEQEKRRLTPWGEMSYLEYKRRLEFGFADYIALDHTLNDIGLPWFASVWDIPSAEFIMRNFPETPWLKVPSAMLTNWALLEFLRGTKRATILSTGMSTLGEIDTAVDMLRPEYLLACTSSYPCPPSQLNLLTIPALKARYPGLKIGWSGHEVGLAPSIAAVALGAEMVERHFTLDRSSWGTDQAASVEPAGFRRLVKDIRLIESALGDGKKRVMPSEEFALRHLRGVADATR